MNNLNLLDTATAEAAGFRPLTIGYQLPQERSMLDNVLADMRRGNINHCLVLSNGSVSVWRSRRAGGTGTQSFQTGTIATNAAPNRPITTKTSGRHNAVSLPKKAKRS